jgi:hypothetical protein
LEQRITLLARVSSNLAVIQSAGLVAAMRSETVAANKKMNREAAESTLLGNLYQAMTGGNKTLRVLLHSDL